MRMKKSMSLALVLIVTLAVLNPLSASSGDGNVLVDAPSGNNDVLVDAPAGDNDVLVDAPAGDNDVLLNAPAGDGNVLVDAPAGNNDVLVNAPAGDGNVFVDVPPDYWAANEIEKFASNNIVEGIGNNLFDPEAGITREQLCKIIALLFNAPLDSGDGQIFADVAPDRWSFAYVNTCKDFLTGYINPFGGLPSYRPEEYATREDIAVALIRIIGVTDTGLEDNYYIVPSGNFTDVDDVSPRLRKYVWLAYESELIKGYPDGTFRPKAGVTRAEAVVLLDRATKMAFSDINGGLFLNISENANSSEYAEIMIKTKEFANVDVDGKGIDMGSDGFCIYYVYYNGASERTVTVTASQYGKTITKQFTARRAGTGDGGGMGVDAGTGTNLKLDISYPDTVATDTALVTFTAVETPVSDSYIKVNIDNVTHYLTNGVKYDSVIQVVPPENVVVGNTFSTVLNLEPGVNVFNINAYSAESGIIYDTITIACNPDNASE